MAMNENQAITVKEMVLSISIFGVIGLIGILIWKGKEFGEFIFEIFNPSDLLISSLIGIGIGIIAACMVALLVRMTKTKMPKSDMNNLMIEFMKKPFGAVIVGVLPGLFEELLFRGFLLALMLSFFDTTMAIVISTAVFWMLHIPQYKTSIVLNGIVIVLSVVVSLLFIEFGTLWAPIFAHGVYNYLVTVFVQKGLIEI